MTNRDTAVVIVYSVLRELPTMITRLIIFNHRFEIHVISRHTSSASSTDWAADGGRRAASHTALRAYISKDSNSSSPAARQDATPRWITKEDDNAQPQGGGWVGLTLRAG